MMVAGLMLGVSGANADSISPIELMVCNSGITQNYDGLAAADTLQQINYNIYVDANCGTYSGTAIGTTGTLNLAAGSSSFQLCYNVAANSLPQAVCNSAPACASATCSFEVFQIQAVSTGQISSNPGNCVNVVCDATRTPTSWANFSSTTLSF
tara:strand:- start:122317 stop:122775 length:459 start_codon:yes stop_codon:yes gene_type:complete